MKLSNSFIQAIGVVVMLAELPEKETLKSSEISSRMGTSPSYLLKIAKKLKDADILCSEASKRGGYSLKKPVDQISFLDIFDAIESENSFFDGLNFKIFYKMFLTQNIIAKKGKILRSILGDAEEEYRNKLSQHFIVELVPTNPDGSLVEINWRTIIEEKN
ncbi:Rrf2 family transcriptional regulator [Lactococcus lactis]|uniref:Rrf2 family transcriptional regulator n=1 Tax=Lactococcus lactis TaxID=1358 RepID=A0A9X4NIR6_9LACT|nr:Rrf2 family transcriptional regulator [Lactococcus lactis]MDG4984177.1 Rrf2 family transcriptional regulator [Lactococcus lactis]